MLRVKDLIVRPNVLRAAYQCSIISFESKTEGDQQTVFAKVYCRRPQGSGRVHYVTITLYDLKKPFRLRRVKVQCDCEDYIFRCEYVLARKKATDLTYALPRPPRETNPRYRPWICKHIARVLARLAQLRG